MTVSRVPAEDPAAIRPVGSIRRRERPAENLATAQRDLQRWLEQLEPAERTAALEAFLSPIRRLL